MRNNSITEELKGKGGQSGQESPSVTSSKHHCLRVSTAITTSKTYNLSTSLPSLSSSWMISFEPEECIIHLLVLNLIWSEKKKYINIYREENCVEDPTISGQRACCIQHTIHICHFHVKPIAVIFVMIFWAFNHHVDTRH